MTGHILIEQRDAVQVIRMNRPDKKNALTRAMYGAMADALAASDADPAIRCRVLLGLPGAFCAGNDIAEFMAYANGAERGTEVYDFLRALARSAKPVVSAVDGVAVGIGTTMNLLCDLTFATPRTTFVTPFVDLGIAPEAASSLIVPQVAGSQQAFALLALGEGLSAERAQAAGLIYAVVGEVELEDAAMAAAGRIAAKPAQALRVARDLIRGPREGLVQRIDEEAAHIRTLITSSEARAAFSAFMNRKKS